MTFDDKQLNTNYVLKLNKRTYEFKLNYGDTPLTTRQKEFISAHYLIKNLNNSSGSVSNLCKDYTLYSKKLGSNMFMFKITKNTEIQIHPLKTE